MTESKKKSEAKRTKLIKAIGLISLSAILLGALAFSTVRYKEHQAEQQTLNDLYDPMIAEDVADLNLESRYITPRGEFMDKLIYPSVTSYYLKPGGRTDKQLSRNLESLAKELGWEIKGHNDEYELNFWAEKGDNNLGVTLHADSIAISIRSHKW